MRARRSPHGRPVHRWRLRRRREREIAPFVFAGVQVLHPKLFEAAPDGAFSLNILYDQAIDRERLWGLRHDGRWFHVGTPDAIQGAVLAVEGVRAARLLRLRRLAPEAVDYSRAPQMPIGETEVAVLERPYGGPNGILTIETCGGMP